MRVWSEYARFFREFRHDFHHTGAILPSGGFLARAMAQPLRGPRPAARILEVGPGTGSVTRAIARYMQPGDELVAVEINPRFSELLTQLLRTDPMLASRAEQIRIHTGAVQNLSAETPYDVIVSGLPLNNFAPEEIRSIFAAFRRLLRPGGVLSYFEYTLVRQCKVPFVRHAERRRLLQVGRIVGSYIRRHQIRRQHVLFNVPPAVVRQLRFQPGPCDPLKQDIS